MIINLSIFFFDKRSAPNSWSTGHYSCEHLSAHSKRQILIQWYWANSLIVLPLFVRTLHELSNSVRRYKRQTMNWYKYTIIHFFYYILCKAGYTFTYTLLECYDTATSIFFLVLISTEFNSVLVRQSLFSRSQFLLLPNVDLWPNQENDQFKQWPLSYSWLSHIALRCLQRVDDVWPYRRQTEFVSSQHLHRTCVHHRATLPAARPIRYQLPGAMDWMYVHLVQLPTLRHIRDKEVEKLGKTFDDCYYKNSAEISRINLGIQIARNRPSTAA